MVVGECIYCQRIITTFLNKDGSPGTHDGSEQVDCRLSCEDIAASITTNTSDSTLSGKQRACNEVADRDWESYKAWWQVYNKDVVKVDSNDAEIVISKQLEELHTKLEHLNFKGRDYILGAHQAQRVAMFAKHFGLPVPEMYSHYATNMPSAARDVLAPLQARTNNTLATATQTTDAVSDAFMFCFHLR